MNRPYGFGWSFLRRLGHYRRSACVHHILNKDSVSVGGIVDENVRHRADKLAVLYYRTAAQVRGQVGITVFIAVIYFFAISFKES